ncbi:MAG TPA: aminotransferase class I/II-fold pyridoxal phosphate-dependent enzyme [Thermoanaerobaculia bacterium]|nr:aminotransferase class I/II-fold pyridoxal phosphate-dependent enzyme [Thermoanaerobaculia bacterium]
MSGFDDALRLNAALEREAPALFRALSTLGRRAFFQPGSLGTTGAVRLPSKVLDAFRLPEGDLEALSVSPVEGRVEGNTELRRLWRVWQRRGVDPALPSSLPLVTVGISHGLSLAADLFGGEGKAVAVPQPYWGNYRQAFAVRTGSRVLTAPGYVDGYYNVRAISEALSGLPDGEPAVALLNLPSNPGGYSLTSEERAAVRACLVEVAERRPLVVVCDDAYAGFVYEPDVPRASLFWDLIGSHSNLVPVKVDGATKELSFFGGRVGFLTFGLEPESDAARAMESKVKMLVRSGVGSPLAPSQVVLLQALRNERIGDEVERVRLLLEGRYRALKDALAEADPGLLTVLPFNSGCFALVELPEALGLTSEQIRLHLLEHHETGLISLEPRYLRIAHCSVDAGALPELARRVELGVRELTAGS